MNTKISTQQIAVCGLIAAIYTTLGIVFAPIGFGPIQVRVAEAMTILPVFTPFATLGLTVGCALTNFYGVVTGADMLGMADVLFGTAATFIAALMTRALRNKTWRGIPFWAALPPVLVNAVVVGGELTVLMSGGGWNSSIFLINFLQVGFGQLLSCFCIGLPMAVFLQRPGLANRIFPA